MKLTLSKAYNQFGASVGRRNDLPDNRQEAIKLRLAQMQMRDGGDYDTGGAYWGGYSKTAGRMFCAWGEGEEIQVRVFVRAHTRKEAKEKVRAILPNACFFR